MRKPLVVAFLFALSSCACGTLTGAVAARQLAPQCPPTQGTIVRVQEQRDLEAESLACVPDPSTRGLLCTDLEKILIKLQAQQNGASNSL